MSTASSADESDASRYSLSYVSKKRKTAKVESASAPKRRSQRIVSQNSDLTASLGSVCTNMDINVETNTDTDTNMEKEANEKEKKWWAGKGSLGSLDIDEKRLPLILARDVKYNNFITRVEKIKARRYFDYRNDGVDDWGAKSLYTNLPTDEYEEPDTCFVPRRLLDPQNPAQNPCDRNGNPWPTIIFEVASSETLQHVMNKINNYWLAPNRCEDVIVIKIGAWRTRHRNQARRPLRSLRCLKFCRTATLQQNPNATTFDAIEEIEFGSWITIDCNCIFTGCPQHPPLPSFHAVISSQPFPQPQGPQPQPPYPLQRPGVAIDLYDIQQAIFRAMGPN
ncbi:hypothetical protein GLOIN_2v1469914 [Rhizophagus clarus]|uniref:Restriction endonuclease domain-containing protein n=1 Tax=Rhizophagus clarus TaxID=94130 RepID=A0A8H3L947_9GLOM|nr:hypothetical protein GLOIN_2v1469914 [Rhizophagus clarus]